MKKPGWMFALIALLSIQTLAQTPAPVESKIDKIFASLNSSDTPGGAVLVIKNGARVLAHGYGVSDLRTRHKIDNHTNFRLASVTKQFTAMAVMLLVHDGKLL